MLEKFIQHIQSKNLANENDRILLTVSGGADSVTMLDLFAKSDFKFAIAHCNFKLRGKDSDEDEKFVEKIAEKYRVKCFSKVCHAQDYAEKNGVSIEMAARNLRYNWFDEVVEKYNFTKIATAHHSDDSVETILMNLSRKTGLKGLLGIPVKNKNIIRPLLFASKDEILEYCKINNLEFRTDKTNFETDFQRNKIRHLIIPEFQIINQAFSQNVLQTADNLKLHKQLLEKYLKKFKKKCVLQEGEVFKIRIDKFRKYEPIELFLYEYFKNYGFNFSQIKDISQSLENQSGKRFYSDTHRLIKERDFLVLSRKSESKQLSFKISENQEKFVAQKDQLDEIILKILKKNIEYTRIQTDEKIGFFDLKKIKYPLIIRKWEDGDVFRPIGMGGKRKKLSSYFKDQKFSQIEKENVWILESDDKIMWVIGYRIDERFKITEKTTDVLKVKLLNAY